MLRKVRDPENDARRSTLGGRPIEAVQWTRRWLADAIVTGSWADEDAAAELLGDLYAANGEPERAALCYQWTGATKKLLDLAGSVGEHLLPTSDLRSGPWWRHTATLSLIEAQHDLVPDELAAMRLADLIDVVGRGRVGELLEGPTRALTTGATKTACVLAARGTSEQARKVLELLADDVARGENQYRYHDEQHVFACCEIVLHFPELSEVALQRLFALAEVGTHEALTRLASDDTLRALQDPSPPDGTSGLTDEQRQHFRARLRTMAEAGRYDAVRALVALDEAPDTVREHALKARDRILTRPDPDGHSFAFGTRLVSDAYLVTCLAADERTAGIDKLLSIADDRREAAQNRQDALRAACNLIGDHHVEDKSRVHLRSRSFVLGHQDGSALDAETTNPHPLSAMKINLGSASLRASGLRLASASAATDDERVWTRDQAIAFLRHSHQEDVATAAVVLSKLPEATLATLDPALLAAHHLAVVRQLAVFVGTVRPGPHAPTLRQLAVDPDPSVRRLLARRLQEPRNTDDVGSPSPHEEAVEELLAILRADVRHSIRQIAHEGA